MQKLSGPFLLSIENVGSLYKSWDREKRFRANNVNINEEMGKQTFLNLQIANPQILGLIPESQNHKFLRYVSPQISNPQILRLIPQSQIRKFPR